MIRPSVEVVTPPAAEPVTAAEVAAHLKLNTGTAEYADLSAFITSARELFERETGRAVLPTVFRQWMPALRGSVELLRGPVLSVEAIGYYDQAEDEQEAEGWDLDATAIPAVVYLPEGDWPALSGTKRRPAWIEFTAGWADVASVPVLVKTAMKLLAGHYYRNREAYKDSAFEMRAAPAGWQAVVDLYQTALRQGS